MKFKLSDVDPGFSGKFKNKEEALTATDPLLEQTYELLHLMFADNKYSLLIILHGIDASGKDGTVRHLFKGANPQAFRAVSFKVPTEEELKQDFLWRCHREVPEAGNSAVFNRSYYEEVTTVKVHPELLKAQRLPETLVRDKKLFLKRHAQINDFERMLSQNGTIVVKFLLHISKAEQKKRFLERLDSADKNWKFSFGDVEERMHWDAYMETFEDMVRNTSTDVAPWHVLPGDKKWYRNYMISKILVETLSRLKMAYPEIALKDVKKARELLA